MNTITCFACRASVPDIEGPTHAYMSSAPGCWATYGAFAATAVSWDLERRWVQVRTDAYAAQHAVNADPRNRRSVVAHLMSLCAVYDLGLAPGSTTRWMGSWIERDRSYPNLTGSAARGLITVVDVTRATDADEYAIGDAMGWLGLDRLVRTPSTHSRTS